jgi:hypothetical protein
MAKLKFVSNHTGSKEMTKVFSHLCRLGWRVERSAKNHVKAYTPTGKLLILGYSSDPRAMKNNIARLRREGVEL